MERGRGGVEFEDLAVGEGAVAERGTDVEVVYTLSLNRGDIVQADQPYAFRVGKREVIAGLEYGVEGMRAGGERRIRVSPHLGYRDQQVPGIELTGRWAEVWDTRGTDLVRSRFHQSHDEALADAGLR